MKETFPTLEHIPKTTAVLAVGGLWWLVKSRQKLKAQNDLLLQRNAALTEQLQQAEHRANTDPLTDLPNRSVLEKAFEGLQKSNSNRKTDGAPSSKHSLILIDLDGFKALNDTWGHNAGDAALRSVAGIMRCNTRERDVPVRQGGDEFILLLPRANCSEAAEVAERIRNNIEQLPDAITASVGVSEINLGISLEGNLHFTDEAMYAAKDAGGNKVMIFDGLGPKPELE